MSSTNAFCTFFLVVASASIACTAPAAEPQESASNAVERTTWSTVLDKVENPNVEVEFHLGLPFEMNGKFAGTKTEWMSAYHQDGQPIPWVDRRLGAYDKNRAKCILHGRGQTEPKVPANATYKVAYQESTVTTNRTYADGNDYDSFTAFLEFEPNDEGLRSIYCDLLIPSSAPTSVRRTITYQDVQDAFWGAKSGARLILSLDGAKGTPSR